MYVDTYVGTYKCYEKYLFNLPLTKLDICYYRLKKTLVLFSVCQYLTDFHNLENLRPIYRAKFY